MQPAAPDKAKDYVAFTSAPQEAGVKTSFWPKVVDTALGAVGLFLAVAALGYLELTTGTKKFFAPPMLASGMIFFAGPEPPNPKSFLYGTLAAATLCIGTLAVLTFEHIPPTVASAAVAAVLLAFYKSTSTMFPPIVSLAGLLLTHTPDGQGAGDNWPLSELAYLASPWVLGHAWLYGCAYVVSFARSRARVVLAHSRFATWAHLNEDEMLSIFRQFDTSGDGMLDAAELKVALRVAMGVDFLDTGVQDLMDLADTDGTGKLSFDEFKAVCKQAV